MHNPFELLNIPVSFQVDLAQLKQHYLMLQKSLHPDNFASQSEQEKRLALQTSAQINDAYQVLNDPIQRAEAILTLAEVSINPENTLQDVAFLMQQMQWREALENIEQEKQIDALETLQQQAINIKQQELAQLHALLDQQQWEVAQQHIDHLKFIVRFEQELEQVEERLFSL